MYKTREFAINGGVWKLAPVTLNDLIAVEQKSLKPESLEGVRFMVYRSLINSHPDMTLEKVGNMITMDNVSEITDILVGPSDKKDGGTPKGKVKKPKVKRRLSTQG